MLDHKKKQRVLLILLIIVGLWATITTIYHYTSYQSWSADYMNSIDSDLHSTTLFYNTDLKEGKGSIVICNSWREVGNIEDIAVSYLEGDFPNHERKYTIRFSIGQLFDHKENTVLPLRAVQTSYKDQDIYYNLYLNPTTDTLKVNGEEVQVEKIPIELEGKSYTLGFWYKLFPKDTVVTVE